MTTIRESNRSARLHPLGCVCPTCQPPAGRVPIARAHQTWRERKQTRQQPQRLPTSSRCFCGCAHCDGQCQRQLAQSESDFTAPWRMRRRPSAVDLLLATPIYHLTSRNGQPISALPGVAHEFAPPINPLYEMEVGRATVRIVYVYQENPKLICREPSWGRSERDVLALYQQPNLNARPEAQPSFYKGRPVKSGSRRRGTTRPDVVLSPTKASLQGMRLPDVSRLDFEIVEVKRYDVFNIPSAFKRLIEQVNARAKIKTSSGLTGKYQSVVLDFRGQEAYCSDIHSAALKVAERLKKEAKGVEVILIQVLLWKGPNCKPCFGRPKTLR